MKTSSEILSKYRSINSQFGMGTEEIKEAMEEYAIEFGEMIKQEIIFYIGEGLSANQIQELIDIKKWLKN